MKCDRKEEDMIKKNLLKAELTKKNYCFKDVADWLGISRTAMTRRLNGTVPIDVVEIDVILKKLQLDNKTAGEIFLG